MNMTTVIIGLVFAGLANVLWSKRQRLLALITGGVAVYLLWPGAPKALALVGSTLFGAFSGLFGAAIVLAVAVFGWKVLLGLRR